MLKLNNKLVLIFSAIIIIAGWLGWWILYNVLHASNLYLYPLIPAFFFVLGTSVINVVTRIDRSDNRRVINIYMILKLAKFILSAVVVLIIFFYSQDESKVLLLTFAGFYMIYIVCEVYIFSQVEKVDKAESKHD